MRRAHAKTTQKNWQDSIAERGVTFERQVMKEEIDNVRVINILSNKELKFFFKKVNGYCRSIWNDCYKNMSAGGLDDNEIKSKVRGKMLQ